MSGESVAMDSEYVQTPHGPIEVRHVDIDGGRFMLFLDGEEVIPNRFTLQAEAIKHATHPGTLAYARQMKVTKKEYGV